MKTLLIEVEGIKCGGCVKKITEHFQGVENVSDTVVNIDEQSVKIIGEDDLSNMKVRGDLMELGFNVNSIKKA